LAQTKKVTVKELLRIIPGNLFSNLSENSKVDYQVKKLHGEIFFKLLLYGILKSNKISTRLLEAYYNSTQFQFFCGKQDDISRHSSISDRLKTIDCQYFKKIFDFVSYKLDEQYLKKKGKVKKLLRFDSTMVAVGAGLIDWGMQVGVKPKDNKGYRQLKFTIALGDTLPKEGRFFYEQESLSEDKTLSEVIFDSAYSKDSIVIFDRGLQARASFEKLQNSQIDFVTRVNPNVRFKEIKRNPLPSISQNSDIKIEEDIHIKLYDRTSKQTKNTFRLIKAFSKSKQEPIFFLTNINKASSMEIAALYKKRWDIEVFFKFLKQEMNLKHLVSHHPNGIQVMLYMTLIASMLILIYKRQNHIEGYKIAKLNFIQELEMEIIQEILELSGNKFKPPTFKKGTYKGLF
jgi:hypothetical protein